MHRLAAVISNHDYDDFGVEGAQGTADIEPADLDDMGLLCVGEEWLSAGYEVIKSDSLHGDRLTDIEQIHISNGEDDIILVDPALKIISEHLDNELDNMEIGCNSQDAVVRLFLILNGANVRKILNI